MPDPLRVLVAGGGVAGLEALLALRDLADGATARTLLTPEEEFVYRPMAVTEPFGRGRAAHHRLPAIAADLGAELVRGRLAAVDLRAREAVTDTGRRLGYDALLIAVGAHSEPAFSRGSTWTPESDPEVYSGLLRDLEEGYTKRVAFVIPHQCAWPLPAYELALMTAWQGHEMNRDDLELTIYTPEAEPLDLFGRAASAAVREDLEAARVQVRTHSELDELPDGRLVLRPDAEPLDAERIVALPRAVGAAPDGVPVDDEGFIPCDAHGRVLGTEAVWAAGDAIDFPTKQGGLAAQQADAAAQSIAALAGVAVEPEPFHPVLRGVLLTGRGQAWLRREVEAAPDDGAAERRALFWPPTKVAGRYLSPYLAALAEGAAPGADAPPAGEPVELDLSA